MNRMQTMKKYLLLGLCLMTVLTFLSGCSSAPSPEQQRSMVPYRLSGSKDGWEISCDVREMTAEEKRTLMDTLKQDWAEEEEMLRDLEEKEAYISSISVLCSDGELEGKPSPTS